MPEAGRMVRGIGISIIQGTHRRAVRAESAAMENPRNPAETRPHCNIICANVLIVRSVPHAGSRSAAWPQAPNDPAGRAWVDCQ